MATIPYVPLLVRALLPGLALLLTLGSILKFSQREYVFGVVVAVVALWLWITFVRQEHRLRQSGSSAKE